MDVNFLKMQFKLATLGETAFTRLDAIKWGLVQGIFTIFLPLYVTLKLVGVREALEISLGAMVMGVAWLIVYWCNDKTQIVWDNSLVGIVVYFVASLFVSHEMSLGIGVGFAIITTLLKFGDLSSMDS